MLCHGNASNLALGYNITNFGVNFVSPMKNSDFILAFETGFQNIDKDHLISSQRVREKKIHLL